MELIHADCLPELIKLPDNHADLVLTDPPYGLNIARTGKVGKGCTFTPKMWDSSIPQPAYFYEMRRVSKAQIIWGGNYFSAYLEPSRGWLVWYKRDGLPTLHFADCELAWTSFNCNARVFNCRHHGYLKDSKETRYRHPAQKALLVMMWCLQLFSKEGDTILDPFMGTGTTGVACALLNRKFIGIERDLEYYNMARERIANAHEGVV